MKDAQKVTVRDAEKAFLRCWGWLFPCVGIGSASLTGGGFWQWVDEGWPVTLDWSYLLSGRAILLGTAGLSIPLVWAIALWLGEKGKGEQSRWGALLLAGVLVIGVEFMSQLGVPQAAFWLAVRTRLDNWSSFLREVCYVRLEETAGRAEEKPCVVAVGSSQVLNGVDMHQLGEEVANLGMGAIRRAMFGMTPLKALAMRPWMPFRPGDTCLMYLSEFDFTNQREFPADWFRPYGSWASAGDVVKTVGSRVLCRHWRDAVDYAMACTWELWRMRDGMRELLFHLGGRADCETCSDQTRIPPRLDVERASWEEDAMRRFADRLSSAGVRLVIFEGDVNPQLYSDERSKERERIRHWLDSLCAAAPDRYYVPLSLQATDIHPDEWKDMTHLNASGRAQLTSAMSLWLHQQVQDEISAHSP
ncbi:MAG: hypothetical protein J6Y19_07625 [Kiritimatiellae bacterium]|nr:hypothetical protein [Kiritimatiellia bacterium]